MSKFENNKMVVWENRSNGTRFMTGYEPGKNYEDNEYRIVIAENISYEDGLLLCKQVEEKNIDGFLDELPEELRNPRMDALIAGIIKNGGR
ncbi:MAG: hypothetical protein JW866_00110 [Ignavibacteriales bacterium]|nr:hypothetical protein [Ignavibacteriales bacterium]